MLCEKVSVGARHNPKCKLKLSSRTLRGQAAIGKTLSSARTLRGQAAIEYLSYFAFFLLIAAAFSSLVFMKSSEELSKRSQERFKSALFYVAQGVKDADTLSKHADQMSVNITLPHVVKGSGITIEGREEEGIIMGNTTIGGSDVYYYVRVGNFTVDVRQGLYGDDGVLTVTKQGEG